MPRPKMIYHGLSRSRNPTTGYYGDPMWAPPTADYRVCPHDRFALRWDPRDGLPTRMYCRACGMGNIHPYHGLTDEEIQAARAQVAELMRD